MLKLNYASDLEQPWVGDWSGLRAKVAPNVEALFDVDNNRRYTYRELDEWACRTAQYLRDELHIGKGDVVALASLNRAELIALFLATSKLGAVLAPQTVWAPPEDLKYFLEQIRPKAIFFERDYESVVREAANPEHVRHYISFDGGEVLRLRDAAGPVPEIKTSLSLNAPCFYTFTSGTTGRPKICVIPHRQVFWNALESVALGAQPVGKSMFFPLFHLGGWASFLIALFTGSPGILGRTMPPERILDLVHRGELGYLGVTEPLLKLLLDHENFEKTNFSRVVKFTTVGQPAEFSLLKPLWDRGVPTSQAYGMTEAGPANVILPPPARGPRGIAMLRRLGATVGRPALHCDMKIVDPDTGKEVGPYEEGVVCLRSLHNFSRYLDDPERTAAFIGKDGWIFTGDIGVRDEEGYLQIIGRIESHQQVGARLRQTVPGWEHGPIDYDHLPMDWVGGLARRRASLLPNSPVFLLPDGSERTYGDLAAEVEQLAAGLQLRGVRRGDSIGLVSNSGEEWVRALLAAGLVGAVLEPRTPTEPDPVTATRRVLTIAGRGAQTGVPLTEIPVAGKAEKPELSISDPAVVAQTGTGESEVLTHGDLLIRSYGILLAENLLGTTARRMPTPTNRVEFWDAVYPMLHVGARFMLQ